MQGGRASRRWILAVSAIFLVAGFFLLFLRSDYVSDLLRARLEPEIQSALGEPVAIRRFGLNILPNYVVAREITIGAMDAREPLLTIRELRIYVSLWSLLKNVIEVTDVHADGAVLRLDAENRGIPRVRALIDRLEKDRGGPSRRARIHGVRITRSAMRIAPPDLAWTIDDRAFSAVIRPGPTLKEFDVRADARDIAWRWGTRSGRVDSVQAEAARGKERWKVRTLSAVVGRSQIAVKGVVTGDANPSLKLSVTVDAGIEEVLDVASAREIAGRIVMAVDLDGPLDNPAGSGRFEIKKLRVKKEEIGRVSGALRVSGRILEISDIRGEILKGTVSGDAEFSMASGPPGYRARLLLSGLSLGRALEALQLPMRNESLRVSGPIELSGPLQGRPETGSLQLTAMRDDTARPIADPTSAERALGLIDKASVNALWSGNGWMIRRADLIGAGSRAVLTGEASPSGTMRLRGDVEAEDVGAWTRTFRAPVAGRSARMRGELTGTLQQPEFRGEVAVADLVVNGVPLGNAAADLAYAGGRFSSRQTVIEDGDARYVLSGSVEIQDAQTGAMRLNRPQLDFDLDATSGRLGKVIALFDKDVKVAARATGRLSFHGEPERFKADGDFKLGPGSIYGQDFDEGSVSAVIDRNQIVFPRLVLRKGKSSVSAKGKIGFHGTYAIEANGTEIRVEDIRFLRERMPGLSGAGGFSVTGSGSFEEPALTLRASLGALVYGDIRYQGLTANLSLEGRSLSLDAKTDDGSIEAKASVLTEDPFPSQATLSLKGARMDPLAKWLLPELSEKILLMSTGKVELAGPLNRPQEMGGWIRLSRLGLSYEGYDLENEGDIALELNRGAVIIRSMTLSGAGTVLSASGNLQLGKRFNVFLSGEAELGLFRLVTPEIGYGKGKAYLALKISDEWKNPDIRGGITLQDGAVRSETLSQTFNIHNMGLFFNERQVLLESLDGSFGPGTLSASGKMEFSGLALREFGFILEVKDGRVHLPIGLVADVDGTVFYQGTPKDQVIKGEVAIRQGLYDRRVEWNNWIAELQQKRKTRVEEHIPMFGNARLNIHLVGNQDLRIDNNLAKVPLDMDVFLRGTVDRPILLGRIEADGGLAFFNRNELRVQSATVDFVDPHQIKPVFDLHATTRIREYQVDIVAQGTADKFNLILTSDPSLAREDILALLVFGRTTSEITPEQQQQVGVQGTAGLVSAPLQSYLEQKIEDVTGFNRFQVDPYYAGTKGSGGPRLTVTKRLFSDRLSVTYATTLEAAQEQVIQIEYILTDHISLIGDRDENGRIGGDLKFHFSFN